MSTNPGQELCPSGGDSEDQSSDSLADADVEIGTGEDTQVRESGDGREVTSLDMNVNLEPYVSKEFKSEQEGRAFYNGYARYTGFSIRKGPLYRSARDRSVTSRIFLCSREGFRRETSHVNGKGNVKRRMTITRVGCKAHLWVKKQPSGMWVVKQFQRDHNHELTPMKVHLLRSHKNILDNVKEYVETLKVVGVDTSKIQSLCVEEARGIGNVGVTDKDTGSENKKKIRELSTELQRERKRSATYREQLYLVLKDVEDHADHLSKQVEDIVDNMKELESQCSK
ncbi:hypothetical protein HHK36_017734 [Tetracentron sinense]|uniref:FAR1 domain-containing protein n=1 Tax=Tetracentron sinense TaxID=13715 RepID=A0A835DCV5_TETSI|nr:hypothetical protein HHK36_017734 [Tetracentron sinense]